MGAALTEREIRVELGGTGRHAADRQVRGHQGRVDRGTDRRAQLQRSKNFLAVDAGQDTPYQGWATAGAALRMMLGDQLPTHSIPTPTVHPGRRRHDSRHRDRRKQWRLVWPDRLSDAVRRVVGRHRRVTPVSHVAGGGGFGTVRAHAVQEDRHRRGDALVDLRLRRPLAGVHQHPHLERPEHGLEQLSGGQDRIR